jgi:Holliday junction DNA helicase RuvA
MIGYLRGRTIATISEGVEGVITLDVGGVGYELTCSANTLDDVLMLGGKTPDGAEIHLWVQTQLREDSLALFGFSTPLEKRMFNSLLKVNGVGPKMAIKILSAATLESLAGMIEAGDVKALSNLPKVGKKTAEQLILSLKGKLVLSPVEGSNGNGRKSKDAAKAFVVGRFDGSRAMVLSALMNLGFRQQEVEAVVEQLATEVDVESGIRQGLQALAGA